DYIAQDEQHTTPRAALVYEPVEGSIFKLLYGQAFRVPNSYLKSETIHTYEGVYEQAMGSHLKGSVSGYVYDIKNLINLTTIGGGFGLMNLNRVRGTGVETELRSKWASVAEGYLNYTYQVTKDRATREELSNSPNHLAKAGVVFFLAGESASLGMEGQYVGNRRTVQPGERVGAYIVANMSLTVRNLYKNLEIQSTVFNLFDARFEDPASQVHAPILKIPQNRRNFNVKVTYLY
ncbi:MAG TPA: TonB-dependent receptor, partial [Nitrospiria bacterium]|nr:TonB-dependent receptor [Nitrospiria bacterium]